MGLISDWAQSFKQLDQRVTGAVTGDPNWTARELPVVGDIGAGLDTATGSVDESIGRQFDPEPGGGFTDVGAAIEGELERNIERVRKATSSDDPIGDSARFVKWVLAAVAVIYALRAVSDVAEVAEG